MNGVNQINVCDDISLITLNNLHNDTGTIYRVFADMAQAGINIDMITKSAPLGGHISISFTAHDEDIATILPIVRAMRAKDTEIKPLISSSNSKIQLFGEEMRHMNGVAANAIKAILEANGEIMLLSTSEIDISILVTSADVDGVVTCLENEFSLKADHI